MSREPLIKILGKKLDDDIRARKGIKDKSTKIIGILVKDTGIGEVTIRKYFNDEPVGRELFIKFCEKVNVRPALDFNQYVISIADDAHEEPSYRIKESLRSLATDNSFIRWVKPQIILHVNQALKDLLDAKICDEIEFCKKIVDELLLASSEESVVYALCGEKSYAPVFTKYFHNNYQFAVLRHQKENGVSRRRVRRIFVERQMGGFKDAELAVIKEHQAHRQFGVEAWILPKEKYQSLATTYRELLPTTREDWVGFIIIDRPSLPTAVIHLRAAKPEFMSIIVTENLYLIAELKAIFATVLHESVSYSDFQKKSTQEDEIAQ